MDGPVKDSPSELDDVIRDIVMMQARTCVTEVTCVCGKLHRIPLDGYRICECGRKVLSPIFDQING